MAVTTHPFFSAFIIIGGIPVLAVSLWEELVGKSLEQQSMPESDGYAWLPALSITPPLPYHAKNSYLSVIGCQLFQSTITEATTKPLLKCLQQLGHDISHIQQPSTLPTAAGYPFIFMCIGCV